MKDGQQNSLKHVSLLLETYKIKLPDVSCYEKEAQQLPGVLDTVSSQILQNYHPVIYKEYSPRRVIGDGNCLYRAISLHVYGNENKHTLVRLLTAVEIIKFQKWYNLQHPSSIKLIDDVRIIVSPFKTFLESTLKIGEYGEMMHIYALSSILKKPIRSYYPPVVLNEFVSGPFSRKVIGRNVKQSDQHTCTLMWTSMSYPKVVESYSPNHFCLLYPITKPKVMNMIDLTGDFKEESNLLQSGTSNFKTQETRLPEEDTCSFSERGSSLKNSAPIKDEFSNIRPLNQFGQVDDISLTVSDEHKPEIGSDVLHPLSDEKNPNLISSEDSSIDSDTNLDETSYLDKIQDEPTNSFEGPEHLTGDLINGLFMDTDHIIKLLKSCNKGGVNIPTGVKENVFFVINNEMNVKRRDNRMRSSFSDDCGVWTSTSGATPKLYFIEEDDNMKRIYFSKGKYGYFKMVNKERKFIPSSPQPDTNKISIMHVNYSTLKKSNSYKRRISYLDDTSKFSKLCVIEYIGQYPGRKPHGNSTVNDNDYIRTPSETLEKITDLTSKNLTPKSVYNKLILNSEDDFLEPRNMKQIYNKMHHNKRILQPTSFGNFADQVQHITSSMHENKFIQQVIHTKGARPAVILYSNEQIEDIKANCCSGLTCLSFDRTFNLGYVYATVGVFKQLSLTRMRTKNHPIFIGPIFLHVEATEKMYSIFFNALASDLKMDCSKLVLGSDDERALRNAMKTAFPLSNQIVCTRHLFQNIKHYLQDKIGLTQDQRSLIIGKIKNLFEANDSYENNNLIEDINT